MDYTIYFGGLLLCVIVSFFYGISYGSPVTSQEDDGGEPPTIYSHIEEKLFASEDNCRKLKSDLEALKSELRTKKEAVTNLTLQTTDLSRLSDGFHEQLVEEQKRVSSLRFKNKELSRQLEISERDAAKRDAAKTPCAEETPGVMGELYWMNKVGCSMSAKLQKALLEAQSEQKQSFGMDQLLQVVNQHISSQNKVAADIQDELTKLKTTTILEKDAICLLANISPRVANELGFPSKIDEFAGPWPSFDDVQKAVKVILAKQDTKETPNAQDISRAAELDQKEQHLKEVERQLVEANKQVEARNQELTHHYQGLVTRERVIAGQEEKFKQDLDSAKKELAAKKKGIYKRENAVAQREQEVLNHRLRPDQIPIDKNQMSAEIKQSQSAFALNLFQQDLVNAEERLKRDQKTLSDQQGLLAAERKEIERRMSAIDNREVSLGERSAQLDKREAELKARDEELELQETDLAHADRNIAVRQRELDQNIQRFEERVQQQSNMTQVEEAPVRAQKRAGPRYRISTEAQNIAKTTTTGQIFNLSQLPPDIFPSTAPKPAYMPKMPTEDINNRTQWGRKCVWGANGVTCPAEAVAGSSLCRNHGGR